jgi:hypothetical protein
MFMKVTRVFGDDVICAGRFSVYVIFKVTLFSNYCDVHEINVFRLFFFYGKIEIGNCCVEIVENRVYVSKHGIVYQ